MVKLLLVAGASYYVEDEFCNDFDHVRRNTKKLTCCLYLFL